LDQNPVDGSYKEISVIPIFDEEGQVEYVLENVKDVTERVSRQRILESKNEELEQFAYTVSHDLKSPLVTIKGFIGLLQQDVQSQRHDRMERYLNHISNASDKMVSLLDDLLQLSRAGRSVTSPEAINMESLAYEIIEILNGTIQKTKARVVVNPGMPEVFGDKIRIRQVLQNLVENSLKYRGAQKNPLIEIGSSKQENEKINLFFIKDNGIGIHPEYHEKVFGVFDQLINDKGGTGIGLSLVKKIIELHHGSIWIESSGEEGRGTIFWFTLPAK
jgi:signal transduction histidine kinase